MHASLLKKSIWNIPCIVVLSNSMIVLFKEGSGQLQCLLPKALPQKTILKTFYMTKTTYTAISSSSYINCCKKNFSDSWILNFLKITKTRNFVILPPAYHIRKPRCQMKHRAAAILWHNNKFTSEICLLGFR